MSTYHIARPTENAAIGNAMRRQPSWSIGLLLADRITARRSLDLYADHLLGYRIQRALAGATGVGER